MESFQKRQDSLRGELLKIKNDELLLNTVFEEHYIRGLVINESNFLKFILPFNLHALDCGAPDCYTTELTFEISSNAPLKIPLNVIINGATYGCIEDKNWSSDFALVELNEQLVNFYSAELQSNLYFTKKGRLIYFPHEKGKSISLNELDKMYDRWEFDDAAIVPYLSTVMTTSEYDYFLNKN